MITPKPLFALHVLILMGAATAACRDPGIENAGTTAGPAASPRSAGRHSAGLEVGSVEDAATRRRLEQLRSLPYVALDPESNTSLSGVTRLDTRRANPGYGLYADEMNSMVYLVDLAGEKVHTWSAPIGFARCSHSEILPNGLLALVCTDRYLGLLRWDSELEWKLQGGFHHDVALRPDGSLLAPVHEKHDYRGRSVLFDSVVAISREGERLEEWSTLDHLEQLRALIQPSPLDEPGGKIEEPEDGYDYFHLNTVEILPHTPLGRRDRRFRAGNILLCLRNVDLILILDQKSRKPVWHWGPGVLDKPHMPTLLQSGRVLVYDNGAERGYSRILEIDPTSGEIVWSYRAEAPESFFSPTRGSNQRLANGNTLIAEADRGRAFEVTPSGEIVWEFWNPELKDDLRKRIYRMTRYAPGFIEPLMARGARPSAAPP